MNLQYRLSSGDWVDCIGLTWDKKPLDQTESFLIRCENNNGINESGGIVPNHGGLKPLTRDEVISALRSGKKLRNAPGDWYSECRAKPEPKTIVEHVETRKRHVCKSCRQSGFSGGYPFSTHIASGLCDDCV